MNWTEASKTVARVEAAAIASNATSTAIIDTLGFAYAAIDVMFQPANVAATNSALAAVLQLSHADANAATNYSNIVAFTGGTATSSSVGFTIPSPTAGAGGTVDTNVVRFNVDMRGKKRFLRVQVTPNTSGIIAVNCRLSKGVIAPTNSTEANVKAFVSG